MLIKRTISSRSLQLLVIFLAIGVSPASAQRKKGKERADSLIAELPKFKEDTGKARLLQLIAETSYTFNPDDGIKYGKKGVELAEQLNWPMGKANAYSVLGTNYWVRSEFATALDYYFKSLEICETYGYKTLAGSAFGNIALVYTNLRDYPKAVENGLKAQKIYEETKDTISIARNFGNLGNVYKLKGDLPKALEYYEKAIAINEARGLMNVQATVLVNVADVYTLQKNYAKALPYYSRALKIHETSGSKRGIAIATANIGSTYLYLVKDSVTKVVPDSFISADNRKNLEKAVQNLDRSMVLLKELNFAEAIQEVHLALAESYERLGVYNLAFDHYRLYEQRKDSVFSKEKAQAIAKLETERELQIKDKQIEIDRLDGLNKNKQIEINQLEVSKKNKQIEIDQLGLTNKDKQIHINQLDIANKDKQIELDKLAMANKQKQIELDKLAIAKKENERVLFIAGIILLMGIIVYIFRAHRLLGREKQKSENLLLNILPTEVAEELKTKGMAEAKYFDNVTILFTDFVNFTGAGERMSSTELVHELDSCFKAFDDIVSRYNVEKIKTIGDAYLAVSGLPLPDGKHAENVVNAALEIRSFMLKRQTLLGDKTFEIRIGIHSGSVVAGIVGVKKFSYDIWGDTVNTAARMEQSSHPGMINISESTYELVGHKYACDHRGEVEVKNKGKMSMYFLEKATIRQEQAVV
jgi:adenylate cyclase